MSRSALSAVTCQATPARIEDAANAQIVAPCRPAAQAPTAPLPLSLLCPLRVPPPL